MENSSGIPWQYCRTYGLDFPTSSTITGMRGAAGGHQTAAQEHPAFYFVCCLSVVNYDNGKN